MKTITDFYKMRYSHSELQLAVSSIILAYEDGKTEKRFDRSLCDSTIQTLKTYGIEVTNGEDDKGKFAVARW